MDKIFEKNFGFHVKQFTTGKIKYLVYNNFLLVLTKCPFWGEDWSLGYDSMQF